MIQVLSSHNFWLSSNWKRDSGPRVLIFGVWFVVIGRVSGGTNEGFEERRMRWGEQRNLIFKIEILFKKAIAEK